jgi:ceramide glucosyltransferase
VWILLCLATAIIIDLLAWHGRFARAIDRPPPPSRPLERYRSVTVVRPIRGVDPGMEENLRAALDTGYPGEVETLFVFDEETDPGLLLARRAVEEHRAAGRPGRAEVIVAGAPPPGRTGKLNAMIVGLKRARGELVAFGDSDTRPHCGLLAELASALAAGGERAGCAFAPVVVVGPFQTIGDAGYALLLNALYGPAVARAAARCHELPFIMGQLMLFRRETLAAIGGLECAEGQLTDDMYIGRCVHRAGLTNIMIKRPLAIAAGGLGFAAFLGLYRRWLLFGENGLSMSFTWPLWLRGAEFWGAIALMVVALITGAFPAAAVAALALLLHGVSTQRLARKLGAPALAPAQSAMAWVLYLFAPIMAATTIKRRVNWRGRDYALGARAALDPAGAAK